MHARFEAVLVLGLSVGCSTGATGDPPAWNPSGGVGGETTGAGEDDSSTGEDSTGDRPSMTSTTSTSEPMTSGPEPTTTGPEPTTTGETSDCDFVRVIGVGGDGLNVRSGPGLGADVLGGLFDGQVVSVLQQTVGDLVDVPGLGSSDVWFEIETSSLQGFVTAVHTECTDEPPEAEWVWPVPLTGSIGQDYGNPIEYQSCGFHTGLDIGGSIGDPVVAVSDGVVVHVGPMWFSGAGQGRGPYAIIIEHGDGLLHSTYGHNDTAFVVEGEVVSTGDLIAELGTLGYSTGPHLHFEMLDGTPFTGNWQVPFADACEHYRDPKLYVLP